MEEKIISMYVKGMTASDIESHMRELYDIGISDSTISRITDKILPIVKEWQERPLEDTYAVVFMHHPSDPEHHSFCIIQKTQTAETDLKQAYATPTEESALAELDSFEEKWGGNYPKITKSQKDNWTNLSTYFKYPKALRHLIYMIP